LGTTPRDDRVLTSTRVLSAGIVPFLIAGFVILYLFPGDTGRLFAWPITPTMTPMVLASAYLGGAYFFVRVLRERHWHVVKAGFPAVALFAGILGVCTIVHWDRFTHTNPAFWVWAALYFLAPFLVLAVWLANRRYADAPTPADPRLSRVARWGCCVVAVVALAQGAAMVLAPLWVIPAWPWALTPLTCRVLGAVFCLGAAALVVVVDDRWTTVRLMLEVEVIMLALVAGAAGRARDELATDRPLTWVMLVGFSAVLVASAALWASHERGCSPRRAHGAPRCAAPSSNGQ
jgi:hypothetical protein